MGLYTNMGGVGKTCFISRVAKLKSEKILENRRKSQMILGNPRYCREKKKKILGILGNFRNPRKY